MRLRGFSSRETNKNPARSKNTLYLPLENPAKSERSFTVAKHWSVMAVCRRGRSFADGVAATDETGRAAATAEIELFGKQVMKKVALVIWVWCIEML